MNLLREILAGKGMYVAAATLLLSISGLFHLVPAVAQQPAPNKAVKKVPGYALTLLSFSPDTYEVLATTSAIKVSIVGAHCTVVSRAPKWDIYAWRDQDKTIFTASHQRWCNDCQLQKFNWTADLKPPRSTVPIQFREMPAFLCTYAPSESAGVYIQSTFGSRPTAQVEKEPLAVCLNMGKDYKGGAVIARLLGMPCMPGLPVQVSKGRRLIPSQTYLMIKSMSKISISDSVFDYPKNYKTVPFSEAFFQSKTRSSNINDLFETYSQ